MNQNIFITDGRRPLWQRIVASAAFTACIAVIIFIFLANFDYQKPTP